MPAETHAQTFLFKWGSFGAGDGQFNAPSGLAVDSAGNVYVAEISNHRIQVFAADGTFLLRWGSQGSADGQFQLPRDVAVDSTGNVYVADTGNCRIQKFTSAGIFLTKWGSCGTGVGQFNNSPRGVAIDSADNVYVVDTGNQRIQKFSSNGVFLLTWGSAGSGDGQFAFSTDLNGIAIDSTGDVYVGDSGNTRIQKFTGNGAFLLKWGSAGSGNGQFAPPFGLFGVSVDPAGDVYAVDLLNNRVQKFTSTGDFLLAWGSFGTGDGEFDGPRGVAVAASGVVYIADTGNQRIQAFGAAPPDIVATFFLHGSGGTANPPTLFLDNAAPTATTVKFKDSPSVNFNGGNPWKDVGTWIASPAQTDGVVVALGPLHVWLGLKNSDDQGTQFDLRAEVHKNGEAIGSGETLCVTGVTRNPSNAKEVTVAFGPMTPTTFDGATDVLSLKILTRIGTNADGTKCAGPGGSHSSAVGLRVYFDAVSRDARFNTVP